MLVSNALKYAFPQKQKATIDVVFSHSSTSLRPEKTPQARSEWQRDRLGTRFQHRKKSSLGLKLVLVAPSAPFSSWKGRCVSVHNTEHFCRGVSSRRERSAIVIHEKEERLFEILKLTALQ